jgi:hypothetical protein
MAMGLKGECIVHRNIIFDAEMFAENEYETSCKLK